VDLEDVSLSHIFVWRADVRGTEGEPLVVSPETGPNLSRGELDCPVEQTDPDPCEWSSDSYTALRKLIDQQVPEGDRREFALKAIANLEPANLPGDEEMAKAWDARARKWEDVAGSPSSLDNYNKGLANSLRVIGCDAEGAPFVIGGLLRNFSDPTRPPENSKKLVILAAASLNEKYCPGAHGLTDGDKAKLQKIWVAKLREISVRYPPSSPESAP
jgi:hypothetical protein